MREFVITKPESGQTLEKYVRKLLKNAPLSFIYKTFRKGDIKVNNKKAKKDVILQDNDVVKIYINEEAFDSFLPNSDIIPSDVIREWIVYEDENILAVNKPKGILVTEADTTIEKSLDQLVLEYLYLKGEYDPNSSPTLKPGPAHRIDRNTSGIVLFGKNISALQALFTMMKDKKALSKKYYALVDGVILNEGEVDAPLLKDAETNTVRVASYKEGAKSATTKYKPIKVYGNYTLLDVSLLSGRTHQIRVHLSYISHPIIGDSKYGNFERNKFFKEKYGLKSQFLEAYSLTFNHPPMPLEYLSGQTIEVPLSKEYQEILNQIDE
ncbi:MAG: RluA family pseudouridine synthase [Coprobacillus sp.]|nr:RluA family pseudouridine synthase [Coprobacillus sp.]